MKAVLDYMCRYPATTGLALGMAFWLLIYATR
jgi:hypothetical protein